MKQQNKSMSKILSSSVMLHKGMQDGQDYDFSSVEFQSSPHLITTKEGIHASLAQHVDNEKIAEYGKDDNEDESRNIERLGAAGAVDNASCVANGFSDNLEKLKKIRKQRNQVYDRNTHERNSATTDSNSRRLKNESKIIQPSNQLTDIKEGDFSIQDNSDRRLSHATPDHLGEDAPDHQNETENPQTSFRNLKRREYMGVDYSNQFGVGRSLNPVSFRRASGLSMNKVSERSMDDTPKRSSQMHHQKSYQDKSKHVNHQAESAE